VDRKRVLVCHYELKVMIEVEFDVENGSLRRGLQYCGLPTDWTGLSS